MWRRAMLTICLDVSLSGCPLPITKDVATSEVRGRVVDGVSGAAIPNALIVQTIARGGFWTEPATYDLGRVTSDANGRFVVPAAPRRVGNVSDPESVPQISVFAPGYARADAFGYTMKRPDVGDLRLKRQGPQNALDPCANESFTTETCDLVRRHMGWPP
jgi:hypothetical protein